MGPITKVLCQVNKDLKMDKDLDINFFGKAQICGKMQK